MLSLMWLMFQSLRLVVQEILTIWLTFLKKTTATGALAASIFHFGEVSIADTKAAMAAAGIEVRQ